MGNRRGSHRRGPALVSSDRLIREEASPPRVPRHEFIDVPQSRCRIFCNFVRVSREPRDPRIDMGAESKGILKPSRFSAHVDEPAARG